MRHIFTLIFLIGSLSVYSESSDKLPELFFVPKKDDQRIHTSAQLYTVSTNNAVCVSAAKGALRIYPGPACSHPGTYPNIAIKPLIIDVTSSSQIINYNQEVLYTLLDSYSVTGNTKALIGLRTVAENDVFADTLTCWDLDCTTFASRCVLNTPPQSVEIATGLVECT